MLAAEYHGVLEMYNTKTIRVPKPICYDSTDRFSFLILENLNMTSRAGKKEYGLLGKKYESVFITVRNFFDALCVALPKCIAVLVTEALVGTEEIL